MSKWIEKIPSEMEVAPCNMIAVDTVYSVEPVDMVYSVEPADMVYTVDMI